MEIAHNFMAVGATHTMNRINENGNVVGTIIVNCEGFPETTTLDSLTAATYSNHMRNLSHHASNALKEIVSTTIVNPGHESPVLVYESPGDFHTSYGLDPAGTSQDVTDDLVVLRLVSRKTEAVVAPDSEFHLIVVMRKS